MVTDTDEYVLEGPEPIAPIPSDCLGKFLFESLLYDTVTHDAMIDGFTGETLSYEKILLDSCNLAAALRAYGCTPETIVSISSESNLQFFTPVLAALYVGATMAPLNPAYTTEELKHALNISKPRIVFCSQFVVQRFLNVQRDLPFLEKIIVINATQGMPVETVEEFVDFQLRGERILPYKFQPYNGDASEQLAFILCSSGTTGLPKGVMLTHRNIMTRIAQSRDPRFHTMRGIVIAIMPFFHGYGLNTGLGSICNKIKMVVLKRFEEDLFLKTIQDHKIDALWLAPPLAVFLAKTPKLDKYDLSSVKAVWCGAAPLSENIEKLLYKRLNLDCIKQAYGLTESNLAVTIIGINEKKSGSCGKVITYMKLKVRDPETGKSLGPNQVGEICIKGPMVMKGYYGNEQATKESFTEDGWLRSGDLGYYDEEKYFFIVDRLKELIKYKGYQVAPAELEAVLLNHPKVMDVGVVGLPDDLAGELPMAFVVKQPGVNVTEKELIEFVNDKVSPQKRLRGGVMFTLSIPKNPSGKILRRELRQQLKDHISKMKSKL